MNAQYSRVIQIELNEISLTIVEKLIKKGSLRNFSRINNSWSFTTTSSEQRYEHLEPWIQWISAHTGKSFAEHGIFRLSDAVHLKYPQIWETLSDLGLKSGIVGSMNAVRGRSRGGLFFPAPWA